jgi:hypothetical protein
MFCEIFGYKHMRKENALGGISVDNRANFLFEMNHIVKSPKFGTSETKHYA